VKLVDGLSPAAQAAVIARHGGTEESAVVPLRIHVVRVPAAELPAALDAYRADPQVESAEAVASRRAEWLPNDPQIGTQWALERIGWPALYSTQTPTGSATLALLDTGVDGTHPDLAGRLIPGASFPGGVPDGTDGLIDPSGHGTRLAGLIAAVADNGEGIAGVAYAGVKVMPVTVLDADGVGPDSAIVAGIVWAADHGADVILMGFSSPEPSAHLQDAIDYAWGKGAVLVAATGNDGLATPTWPAASRGVIGVSATDADDALADFSNRGAEVFLAAPGVALATTVGPDGYTAVSGTSPAAALTAGAAALLKAFDPTLTNGVLLGRLARGAAPVGDPADPDDAAKYGYGRLSLSGALADAQGANALDPVEPLGAVAAAAAAGGAGGTDTGPGSGGAAGGADGTDGTPDGLYTSAATPTLTTPTTSNLGANQVTLGLESSATGTGYFTLLAGTGTVCGTGTQVKNGQSSTGAAAFRRGSLKLTANTAGAYTVRNLLQSSAYTVCFTADDGSNLQGTPATVNLTTNAAAVLSTTWGNVGSAGFSAGQADYTSLALAPDGTPYVAYQEYGNSQKATVMRFSGGAWVTVGSAGFSAGQADYTSLAFAPDGTPYVAYRDYGNSGKATVMKFSGGAWGPVGSAGFSDWVAGYTALAFAPDGTPYVAYRDYEDSSKATVMKFSGGAWVTVGSARFSAGQADYTSLAFAPDGTPYVAYRDYGNSAKATVMKFSGGAWVTVGSAGFSAGVASRTSLAFAPNGTPYVAYVDHANSSKATVTRFNGTSWVTVGSAGFSAGSANYPSLAFAPDGTPCLAYADASNSEEATVVKYNGTSWVPVGTAGFSNTGWVEYLSLAFSPDGVPFVAYGDSGNSSKATVMKLPSAITPTTTALTAAPNPAAYGAAVTLTATVSPPAATGTVTFKDGTTTLGTGTLSGGTATYQTSALSVGPHSLTAVYGGNASYGGSTSTALTQTITKADQTISFANPGSKVYGSTPSVSATASSGLTVTFGSATPAVCTSASGGALTFLTVATCTINADQAGNANYNAATRVSQSFTVTAATLTIASPAVTTKVYDGTNAATITGTLSGKFGADVVTLNGTGTFASVGARSNIAVTSTATLGGSDAAKYTLTQPTGLTGTVGTRPLTVTADAKAKTYGAADPALTYQITSGSLVTGETFSGALGRTAGETVGTYAIGQGTLTLGANYALGFIGANLTISQAATSVALGSAPNPVTAGAPVTLTATLSPTGATGTVTFMDGAATLGNGPLSGGTATLSTSALSAGSHSLTAVYAGDDNYQGATSPALTQVVQVPVTIATNPAGLTVTVDGTGHPAPYSTAWTPGASHQLAVPQYQGGAGGTRAAFAAWSDGGALSHTVTAPAAGATFTATFATQYQLTTAAAPASAGLIAPATGGWFAAGTTAPVTIYPVVGYALASWTVNGTTTETAVNTQPVLMSGPMSVTATLAGAQPELTAGVNSARTGTKPIRTWTLTLTNRTTGTGPAPSPRFDSLTLTQTYPAGGPTCAPVVGALPTLTGPLAVGATLSGTVGIDFTGCNAGARFRATLRYSDGGRAAGISTLNNQPQ